MKIIKKIVLIMTFVLISSAGVITYPAGVSAEGEGSKAPDFSLKDVNGREFTLSSLRGKAVILSFWATWCPSCKEEMPRFSKVYKEMKGRGLEIVAVSSDYSIGYLKDYLSQNSFDFIMLFDEKRSVTRQYKVPYLPVAFLIDKNGMIVEKIAGEFEWPSAQMREKLERLLR